MHRARRARCSILVAGFALRVWNIDYGLPFVYTIDEGSHFTTRAVEMFWQDLDPGYYQNPSALHVPRLRAAAGDVRAARLPVRPAVGNVTDQFDMNPTAIWIAARTLAAVLCMARRGGDLLGGAAALGRARGPGGRGVLAFAFLPVAYSRVAVTDVGALIGVALVAGLRGAAPTSAARLRRLRAGRAPPPGSRSPSSTRPGWRCCRSRSPRSRGCARTARARARRARARRRRSRAVVFVALNPYFFGSLDAWWTDLRDQAEVAARPAEARPGVGRLLLLPRQPHLGPRLGGRARGARRRACSSCAATSCAA